MNSCSGVQNFQQAFLLTFQRLEGNICVLYAKPKPLHFSFSDAEVVEKDWLNVRVDLVDKNGYSFLKHLPLLGSDECIKDVKD